MKQLGGTDLKRLHRSWNRSVDERLGLILDAVHTPWNVGSIVRTAAAFKVAHMWVSGGGTTPDHARARKTALGTERYVPWASVPSIQAAVDEAKQAGFKVVGLELAEGAVPIHEADLTGDVCLAFGNEDHGLASGALNACDLVAYIPQMGKVGSLNVATAAALGLYEVRRRHFSVADRPAPSSLEDAEVDHEDPSGLE